MSVPQPRGDVPLTARTPTGLAGHRYAYDGCAVLALSGEIDVSCLAALRQLLLDAVDRGHGKVVVDLTDVTFMDLAAVGELVQALRRAGWQSGSIRLLHPTPFVRRVLDLTNAGSLFPIHDTLDAALAAGAEATAAEATGAD